MMRLFLIAASVGVAFMLGFTKPTAAQSACPKAKLKMQYDINGTQPIFSHKLSLALMQKYKHQAFKNHRELGELRGFHTRDHKFKTNYAYDYVTVKGKRCVTEMTFRFTYRLVHAIHVAKDYTKGSCEYNVILEHEKQHASFEMHVLRKNERKLKAMVRNAVVKNIRRSESVLNKATHIALMRFWREVIPQANALHAKIDTPENYARESAKCSNW